MAPLARQGGSQRHVSQTLPPSPNLSYGVQRRGLESKPRPLPTLPRSAPRLCEVELDHLERPLETIQTDEYTRRRHARSPHAPSFRFCTRAAAVTCSSLAVTVPPLPRVTRPRPLKLTPRLSQGRGGGSTLRPPKLPADAQVEEPLPRKDPSLPPPVLRSRDLMFITGWMASGMR